MPLQATSGAASYDAFGGGVPVVPAYIEEVFSTYLYTGNGNTAPETQTINNGIDLSGKGGLVWIKNRTVATSNVLFDTVRGATKYLVSNSTAAEVTDASTLTSFNNNGFSVYYGQGVNGQGNALASWTFRKQPKFFDVVTYTGNGSGNRIITSSLGSPIGCVFIKRTDSTSNWATAHRKDGSAVATGLSLNTTAAALYPNSTNDTFDATGGFNAGYIVDSTGDSVNVNGATYVAYLFAHNAGGFGLTGTDNVISCGSYVGTEASLPITLGYEPQWVMIKDASVGGTYKDWYIFDNMRKLDVSNSGNAPLRANTSGAEGGTYASSAYNLIQPTSTGMIIDPSSQGPSAVNQSGSTYIYIAIRRGPMKVPTVGTTVFSPVLTATASETVNTVNFAPDMQLIKQTGNAVGTNAVDRLRGVSTRYQYNDGKYLLTSSTAAEASNYSTQYWNNTGFSTPYDTSGISTIYWTFKRAPSFFDEVCYTGTGSARTLTHNLGVVPELMIVKRRDGTSYGDWLVYHSALGNTKYLLLNTTDASATANSGAWNYTNPTSTQFTVGDWESLTSTATYVAYLFATCAGVSKCTAFTGTGTLQTIDCGFTAGSRFVLIKRTDSTGDWYVWDSSRGLSSSTDPYLLLNSTAAEVTSTNWVDTTSTGFQVTAASGNNVNINGASYIALAIA